MLKSERRGDTPADAGRGWRAFVPEDLLTPSPERIVLLIAIPTLLILLPWILPTQRLLSIAILTAVNAVVLYGLALLFGQIGMISIAHAALMGVGAYLGAILLREFGISFWAALPLAGITAALAAGVLGFPSIRVSGHHFLILTFASGELLAIVLTNGGDLTGGAQGLFIPERIPSVLGQHFVDLRPAYFLILAFLGVAMLGVYGIAHSPLGRTMRAVRENEPLAGSLGINVNWTKVSTFMISGLFAGVGGVYYGYFLRHIEPRLFDAFDSLLIVLMLLLGGARWLLGPLAGAVVVWFLPEVLDLDPILRQIVYGMILIAVILLLPQGVVGGIRSFYLQAKEWTLRLLRPRLALEGPAPDDREDDDRGDP